MSQIKVSIPDDEWAMVQKHFEKHKESLKTKYGVRSPTALLRHWIREGAKTQYSESE